MGGLWYGYVWMGKRANDTFTYLYRHYPCEVPMYVCMYVCMVYVGTHKAGIIAMMTDDWLMVMIDDDLLRSPRDSQSVYFDFYSLLVGMVICR